MEEQYEPSPWERIEPTLYGIALLVMNVGLVVAGLAAVYLLMGLFGGGLGEFNGLPKPERVRVLSNIALAGKALNIGLIAVAVGGGFAFRNEESAGYSIGLGAAAVGLGVPFAVRTFAGATNTTFASTAALKAFVVAATVPAVVGGLLIVVDVIRRGISAVGNRDRQIDRAALTYGGAAQRENKPVRTSLLAKCWEGGFCRDFIRPHCPIFLQRKACWREKRGCYCEEDIVSEAASKVQGVALDMAPDPKLNYANPATPAKPAAPNLGAVGDAPLPITFGAIGSNAPAPMPLTQPGAAPKSPAAGTYRRLELTMAQKKERCRNCVIYNEHQKEKYNLLLPVTMLGGFALCFVASPLMRKAVDTSLTMAQTLVNRASFGVGAPGASNQLVRPGETVEWIFVGAFSIMLVAKLLQVLEWACFKAKI